MPGIRDLDSGALTSSLAAALPPVLGQHLGPVQRDVATLMQQAMCSPVAAHTAGIEVPLFPLSAAKPRSGPQSGSYRRCFMARGG